MVLNIDDLASSELDCEVPKFSKNLSHRVSKIYSQFCKGADRSPLYNPTRRQREMSETIAAQITSYVESLVSEVRREGEKRGGKKMIMGLFAHDDNDKVSDLSVKWYQ